MEYKKLLDKSLPPNETDILEAIGKRSSLWVALHEFLESSYDFTKQLAFFSKNYGWTVRYRKSKKTLISCFPEEGAFSVLLVLGHAEADKVNGIRQLCCQNFLDVFDATEQLRDGRWMWFRILGQEDLDTLIRVVQLKRKAKNSL